MLSFWNNKQKGITESIQSVMLKPIRVIRHDEKIDVSETAVSSFKNAQAWEQMRNVADFEMRRTSPVFAVNGRVYGRREGSERVYGRRNFFDEKCSESNCGVETANGYSRRFRGESHSDVWSEDVIFRAFSGLKGLNVAERGLQ